MSSSLRCVLIHPNIGEFELCLSALPVDSDKPKPTIRDIIESILYALHHPNAAEMLNVMPTLSGGNPQPFSNRMP
jgi:ubiquitin-protein ligase